MVSHCLKVILKEESQPKITNEHAIIDYVNVITTRPPLLRSMDIKSIGNDRLICIMTTSK